MEGKKTDDIQEKFKTVSRHRPVSSARVPVDIAVARPADKTSNVSSRCMSPPSLQTGWFGPSSNSSSKPRLAERSPVHVPLTLGQPDTNLPSLRQFPFHAFSIQSAISVVMWGSVDVIVSPDCVEPPYVVAFWLAPTSPI
jgi:hypothetical protein